MIEKRVKIIDPIGLHARPASIFVATVSKYPKNSVELVTNEDKVVNAKSILVVMGLALEAEQEFKIRVDGNDAKTVITEIVNILEEEDILRTV